MAEEKFMLVSLEDSKSKAIAEVISSNTCKKIINHLAEHKEASQKDLSDSLNIPLNTLDYNIKKLLESGFIQKRKNFFWSKKGKKIIMYELSNKSIVFSPRKTNTQKVKSIIPAVLLTLVGTFALWVFEKIKSGVQTSVDYAKDSFDYAVQRTEQMFGKVASAASGSTPSAEIVREGINSGFLTPQPTPVWVWFLAGAFLAILVVSLVNWSKL